MGTNGMMKLEKSLIGIGLKLRGGSMAAKLSGNDVTVYWNSKLMSDGGDPMSLKEGDWIEFNGYSKNGKAYTAKELKAVDGLDVIDEDVNQESKPTKQKPNNSIDSSVQSAGMVRVRAVNDISVASLDKEISFGDQIKYVKRAVNLLHASSMESEEVGAEYDDKGQKLPF